MPEYRSLSDADRPHVGKNFNPRFGGNFEIPDTGILDAPYYCLKINYKWLGHIIGVLDVLDQSDSWQGTETEIDDARAEIRKLLGTISRCDETDMLEDVRITDCGLDVLINGQWLPRGSFEQCARDVATSVSDELYENRDWDTPTANETPEVQNNLDCVWGGALEMTRYVLSVTELALDALEAASDIAESVNDFLGRFSNAVPVSRIIEGMQLASSITIAVGRLALTDEVRDLLACELFCLIQANNNLLDDSVFEAWTAWIGQKSLEIPGESYTIGLSLIQTFANTIVGRRYAYQRFILGTNNCEDDWQILCEPCTGSNEWCYDFVDMTDITILLGSLTTQFGNPQPSAQNADNVNSATYPLEQSGTTNGIATAVEVTFATPITVTDISYDYWMQHSADNIIARYARIIDKNGIEIDIMGGVNNNEADGAWHTVRFDGFSHSDVGKIIVYIFRTSNPAPTGTAYIDNICVNKV